MLHHWLATARNLLQDLKSSKRRNKNAHMKEYRNPDFRYYMPKPDKSQLDLLNIDFQYTYDISGLENIGFLEKFFPDDAPRRRDLKHMIETYPSKWVTRADSHTTYTRDVLSEWIEKYISEYFVGDIDSTRRPLLRMENDTYTGGIRPDMTVLFNQETEKKQIYISLINRREHYLGGLITSMELYTLFTTATIRMKEEPHTDLIEVRLIIIYTRWIQIMTAKTTRSYLSSIIEGKDNIADKMEISLTPWLDFMTVFGQNCIWLAIFESVKLQDPDIKVPLPFNNDIKLEEQRPKSLKRKISAAEPYRNKKMKI